MMEKNTFSQDYTLLSIRDNSPTTCLLASSGGPRRGLGIWREDTKKTARRWGTVHQHLQSFVYQSASQVQFYDENSSSLPWQRWKLTLIQAQSSSKIPGLGSLPPYDESEEVPGQPSTGTNHTAESERDDFGTVVTEVTVVTTRKKYRVADD